MQPKDSEGAYSPVISTHLDSIFNTVIDGVIIIDVRGTIQAVNPAVSRIFGFSPEELVENNVSMLMPTPHEENHDGYLENYVKTGVKKIIGIGREVAGRKKDGSLFPFRLSISESTIDGKLFFTGIVHDITEIKQAQDDLKMVNKQLERIVSERTNELTATVNKLLKVNHQLTQEISLREKTESDLEKALEKEKELGMLKSQFVTMASHEFRTPLSTILSSANILAKYQKAEEQNKREKHVGKISSSVRNMTNILEDVLSLGKLEEGKIENHAEAFELASFVQGIIEKLSNLLKEGQKIELVTKPDKINVVWAKSLTENILNNLLSNAIKYSGEDSQVEIAITAQNAKVEIVITDEGIGIPEAQQKHLFERFFRASNALNYKGTGLGLHIVQEYLTLIGGEINFQSEVGKGSVFTVIIPLEAI